MNRLPGLFLALVLPVSGMCDEAVTIAYAGSTNMQTVTAANGTLILADTASSTAAGQAGNTDEDLPFLDDEDEFIEVYDPLETFNRGMFWFNDKLYFYLMKPLARGFRYVPEPWRVSMKSFFLNLRAPIRIVNAGLQGKFGDAGNELTRFATNTTLGIGGLFDASKDHFGITMKDEDTGQTLGFYGVGPGPYLVLPLFGPSNFRDGIGMLADSRMNLAYYIWAKDQSNYDYAGALAVNAINNLSLDKDTYEGVKQDALDPYLFVRDAFAQYRQNLVDN
jgi:phospholipid-binding lipoprotein MlaA